VLRNHPFNPQEICSSFGRIQLKKGGRWHATATLSEGVTAWFINVRSGALVSSSDFQETSAPSQ
jgi:hypothetical protein